MNEHSTSSFDDEERRHCAEAVCNVAKMLLMLHDNSGGWTEAQIRAQEPHLWEVLRHWLTDYEKAGGRS